MVAGRHVGDRLAHLVDDARALVAEHARVVPRDGPVDHRDVAVAEAGRDQAHLHLGRAGRPHVEVVADLGLLAVEHQSEHVGRSPFECVGDRTAPGADDRPHGRSTGPDDGLHLGVGVEAEDAAVAAHAAHLPPAERCLVVALRGVDARRCPTRAAAPPRTRGRCPRRTRSCRGRTRCRSRSRSPRRRRRTGRPRSPGRRSPRGPPSSGWCSRR